MVNRVCGKPNNVKEIKMIEVKFFASFRELANKDSLQIEPVPDTVQALIIRLTESYPALEDLFNKPHLCAVNQQMAALDTELSNQDEVAFFPPVTGG